jgi:hypothetical protein
MKAASIAAVLLVTLVLGADPAQADPRLVGSWHVTHLEQGGKKDPVPSGMSIVLHLGRTGACHQTSRIGGREKTVPGTYVVKGTELHVTMDGKTDRLRWVLSGDRLTLSKIGTSEVVYLVRSPVPGRATSSPPVHQEKFAFKALFDDVREGFGPGDPAPP